MLTIVRDHVTLPEDFKERAEKVMELHRSSPVAEEKRGNAESVLLMS